MLLEHGRDEGDFLPECKTLVQTRVNLITSQVEISTSLLQACSSEQRLHEEPNWESISFFEGKCLDGILEFVDVDVVAVLAQAAIHNALEDKSHLLFKSADISVEQGKVEIKLLFLEQ